MLGKVSAAAYNEPSPIYLCMLGVKGDPYKFHLPSVSAKLLVRTRESVM